MRTKKDILKELPKFQGKEGSSQVGSTKTYTPEQINAISGYIHNLQNQQKRKGRAVNKPMPAKPIILQPGYTQGSAQDINLAEQAARQNKTVEQVIAERDRPLTLTEKILMGSALAIPAIAGAAVTAPAWAPAVGAALSAPILGTAGLTASNLLWGLGAYLSGDQLIDPNSATRTSINQAIENPTFDNVAGAIGTTGLTGLGFAGLPVRSGLLSLGDDFTRAGQYLTQGPLKNAYKLNPWAFKPQEGMMYRGIGKEGMKDALESKVFRSSPYHSSYNSNSGITQTRFTNNAYYSPQLNIAQIYNKDYIAEVPRSSGIWNVEDPKLPIQFSTRNIPINEGRILQKDWLRGYKEVPKPATISNPITNITQKDIQGALINILKEQKPSWFIEEPPKTALTDIIDQINTSNFLKDILKNPNKQALYTPVSNRVVLALNPPLEGGRQIRLVDEGAGLFKQKADELGEGYNLYDLLHQTQYHIRKNKYGGKINYLKGNKI